MPRDYIFSSESVSEGHPDKVADFIADVILDAYLKADNKARVACEVLVKTGFVLVAGEITSKAELDVEQYVREAITQIGYTIPDLGFDATSCAILTSIGNQSADIAIGVDHKKAVDQGAGDQGIMFGYATNETEELMPAPIMYSHKLMQRQAQLRKSGHLTWLRPDAKCQVSVKYENSIPVAIDNIVLSTQHDETIEHKTLEEAVIEDIIKPIIPPAWLHNTKFFINPTGRFITGGPAGDCGLTGRKIIVDTYGGMAHHGGGSFSGKDPSKVDRCAAYACRYVAKNIVAANLADKCEVQVAYAIGIAKPTSVFVNTFGTGKLSDIEITKLILEKFDLTPYGIIKKLDLIRPIYSKTTNYGHFGRNNLDFTWEQTDKTKTLQT